MKPGGGGVGQMALSPGELSYVKTFLSTLFYCLPLLYVNDRSVRTEDIKSQDLQNG